MRKLWVVAMAAVLALALAAPAAARDRFWTPEDGRAGVAGPWYTPTMTWLDPLRCDAFQRYFVTLPADQQAWVLASHGWHAGLPAFLALTRTEQCAWALYH